MACTSTRRSAAPAVVAAMSDPNPLVAGKGLEVLSGQSPVASFAMAMQWPDIKKLLVSVRAIPGPEETTEVVIRSPLAYSRKLNYGVGLAVGSGAGFLAGGAAVTGTVALLSGVPPLADGGPEDSVGRRSGECEAHKQDAEDSGRCAHRVVPALGSSRRGDRAACRPSM